MIQYDQLSIGELKNLATKGDIEARRLIEELSPGRTLLVEFPVTVDHWGRDIVLFLEGDIDAGVRLTKKWYSKKALFHPQRMEKLRQFLANRREDGLTLFDIWNRDIVLPALELVMSDPKWGNVSLAEIHRIFRREVRKIIEIDLTDGTTLDTKEIRNISADDTGWKHNYERDPERVLEWMANLHIEEKEPKYYEHFGETIEEDMEESDLIKTAGGILENMNYEDKLILLCPHGEAEDLAKRLGRTRNALYQRKNVLMERIIKQISQDP